MSALPAYLQTITVTGIGTFEMLPRLIGPVPPPL